MVERHCNEEELEAHWLLPAAPQQEAEAAARSRPPTILLKYENRRKAESNSGFGGRSVQIARLIWHAALQQCNFRRRVPKWHFCQLCGHWAYREVAVKSMDSQAGGSRFAVRVRELVADHPVLVAIIEPLLTVYHRNEGHEVAVAFEIKELRRKRKSPLTEGARLENRF